MNSRRFCAGTPGQMPMTHGEVATRVTAVVSSIGSNGMSFCSTALTTCAPTTIATTWPSGGDLTITSVPMMPLAPGRFSTSTCWPPRLLHAGRERAADDVGSAARRVRNDDAYRLGRELGIRREGQEQSQQHSIGGIHVLNSML